MKNLRFHRSLYEQHLEEVSILYDRRLGLLDDPTASPDDLGDLEARIDAHLDALVVGGEAALSLCSERAVGDPGTLFGVVGVFARQQRPDLLEATLAQIEGLDEDDEDDALDLEADKQLPDLGVALSDALRFEAPGSWGPLFAAQLVKSAPIVVAALARVIGYRRLPLGPQLVEALASSSTLYCIHTLLWAVGRVREPTAQPFLYHHAQGGDAVAAATACLALLRLGDPSVLNFLVQLTQTNDRAASLLAITGGLTSTPIVHGCLTQPDVAPQNILAAGLCGDLAVVPWLLDYLERGCHPSAAAEALYLLTGASLLETLEARVEPIDPLAEIDPRDVVSLERLSQDPQHWRAWWNTHGSSFAAGVKHRLGRPASPAVVGETLHHFVVRRTVRELIADELDLLYGPELAVDVDMPAAWQRAAIARLRNLQASPQG